MVGLGNPGPAYAGNRHNIGAQVLDTFAAQLRVGFKAHRSRAAIAQTRLPTVGGPTLGGPTVGGPAVGGPAGAEPVSLTLAKPSGYMNVSGGPVAGLVRYFGVDTDRVLVVHDELDLPFGTLRLKRGGGEGGHNGLRDISKALGTRDYLRLRFGIGRPPGRQDPADFVLRDFSAAERKELDLLRHEAVAAIEDVLRLGLIGAQQRLHSPA